MSVFSLTVIKLVGGVVVGNLISTLILRAAKEVLASFEKADAEQAK